MPSLLEGSPGLPREVGLRSEMYTGCVMKLGWEIAAFVVTMRYK